jgi:hypothetical protein
MLDLVKDELINFENEKEYGIKTKELNYNFLFIKK